EKVSESQRIAAWELLGRIGDPEKLIGYLNAAPASDALVADLKAAAAELHALPSNREGVLWLQYLRKPEQKAFWDAAAAVVARLSPEQRRGLQLRHMAVLVRLS